MRLIDADPLLKAVKENKELYERERLYLEGLLLNAPTVEQNWKFYYGHGYKQAERDLKRPQGMCEKCDYRKFSERFIDEIVDLMNKNDITSFEQLSEILKGGAE